MSFIFFIYDCYYSTITKRSVTEGIMIMIKKRIFYLYLYIIWNLSIEGWIKWWRNLFVSIDYVQIYTYNIKKKNLLIHFFMKNEICYVNRILHLSKPAVCRWSIFNFWDECRLEKERPFFSFFLFFSSSSPSRSVFLLYSKRKVFQ
jgi:hypothetical protein